MPKPHLKSRWKKYASYLSGLLFLLSIPYAIFLTYAVIELRDQAEQREKTIVFYDAALSDQATPQDRENLKAHILSTPSANNYVSWYTLHSATLVSEGFGASENITREALNELKGADLLEYIDTLDAYIQGYRPEGWEDPLEGLTVRPEFAKQILSLRDRYHFSENEISALKKCELLLIEQREFFSFLGSHFNTSENAWPGSLLDACTLKGKIQA